MNLKTSRAVTSVIAVVAAFLLGGCGKSSADKNAEDTAAIRAMMEKQEAQKIANEAADKAAQADRLARINKRFNAKEPTSK